MIRLTHASFGYHGKPSIAGLSLTLEKGAFCAIVGGNGAGKSTLLKGIAGLLAPLKGSLTHQETCHYLPQSHDLNLNFPLTLHEFLLLGAQAPTRLKSALSLVKLTDLAHKPLNSLSGGQVQRAIFARLMLSNAQTFLLDEPFSMMDRKPRSLALITSNRKPKWAEQFYAFLHDYELVRHYFPLTLILAGKMLAFGATREVLTPDLMHKAHKGSA